MEQPNYAEQLLLQLNQQRSRGFLCDVIIVVENALFRAHKNVLAARSSYFKSLVLHDNLINLDTEMVTPSVFRQVLDFIYTGQLPSASERSVSALLTAASYLQLMDLAALCRRKLKPSNASKKPSSTSSTHSRHLLHHLSCTPLQVNHGGGSQKQTQDRLQREDLSEEELFVTSLGVKMSDGMEAGLRLRLKSPTGSTATEEVSPSSLQQGSPQSGNHSASSDDTPPNSTYNPTSEPPEEAEDQQQPTTTTSSHSQHKTPRKRPRASGPGSPRVNAPGKNGEEAAAKPEEWREAGGEDALENEPDNSEGSLQSESEDENRNKNSSYVCYKPTAGVEPALDSNLYVCIPCGKGFPSSEQLRAHVDSHAAEEFGGKGVDSEEGDSIRAEDADEHPEKVPEKVAAAEREHVCSVCRKSYVDVDLLRQHERSHWLSRPFPCDPFACAACGMRFTRQYRLTEHARVHSGEKPYECQLCGVKFTQQRNLISHLRMHASPS
ncbi:hypothetical protein LDENG_00176300 [Lucifuga dentata]|nr:hypothetical protein LDENG_00176300 [Lucifuga dentata]